MNKNKLNELIRKYGRMQRDFIEVSEVLSDLNGLQDSHIDQHECKYCGGFAKGPDEDVLCDDCQETFGHAFYSEL